MGIDKWVFETYSRPQPKFIFSKSLPKIHTHSRTSARAKDFSTKNYISRKTQKLLEKTRLLTNCQQSIKITSKGGCQFRRLRVG